MGIFFNAGGKVREPSGIYLGGGNGKPLEIKEVYVGRNGKPVLVWRKGIKPGFVFVGRKGESFYSPVDNMGWNAMAGLDTSADYNGVAYGMGRFVCVGTSGRSYYSTDARVWKPMSGLDAGVDYGAVTYGGGRFVCVGGSGRAYYSTDGVSWKPMSGLDAGVNYNAVAYGRKSNKDVFMCGSTGSNRVYECLDGMVWAYKAKMNGDNAMVYGLSFCNGVFMAAGRHDEFYMSIYMDMGVWINKAPNVTYTGYGIAYGNGTYVCAATSNNTAHICTCKDPGTEWSALLGWYADGGLYGAAYGAGIFAMVGGNDLFIHSTDGVSWTMVPSGRTLAKDKNIFKAVVYGGET